MVRLLECKGKDQLNERKWEEEAITIEKVEWLKCVFSYVKFVEIIIQRGFIRVKEALR